ncbi:hypothetical protein CV093_06000 [Oceanobacillus sp. 143]|nr:hypothetical protein CV093_06000 [Oceanobacillus sp. 143]
MRIYRMFIVVFLTLGIVACSNEEPKETELEVVDEAMEEESVLADGVAEELEEEYEEEIVEEENEEDYGYAAIEPREITDRSVVLEENEHGKVTYLGDMSDVDGFYFAFQYEGDAVLSDRSALMVRLIFDDGTSEIVDTTDPSYLVEHRATEAGEVKVFKTYEAMAGNLARIDYVFETFEWTEEGMKTIEVEPTEETIVLDAAYALEELYFSIEQEYQDDEKYIMLDTLDIDDTTGTVRLTGFITFQEDTDISYRPMLYRPINQSRTYGSFNTESTSFFGSVRTPIELTFTTEQVFTDDDGSIVYIAFGDVLFSLDLRTGEAVNEPVTITPDFR